MELERIRALAELMNELGLTRLSLTEKEESIQLSREGTSGGAASAAAPQRAEPAAPEAPALSAAVPSPMVGVVYLAPAPDAAPYVSVGSAVKKGDVLCIIEAMKLMNEIVAEQDGTIAEVCVENAQVVEYGQPLFRMK